MSDFTQATTKFNKWLILESVAVSPKVEIADLREKNEGRGLVAIVDIAEDEALFTLPRSVIINRENCSLVLDIPLFKEKLSELNHWESLIIVLLYELKVKGDSSRWSPYFNILPVVDFKNYTYNQLAFWLEGELKELLPSLILERVGKDMAQEMYAKLCPIVQELGLKELEGFTLEEYHRIASLIMSYSFDVEKGDDEDEEEVEDEDEEEDEVDEDNDNSNLKSMVPLADTLNADTSLHNAHLTYTDGNLVMRSISKIQKGEQIYNTYSELPNSEILRKYGYVETNGSLFDFGEVPMRIIRAHFEKQGLTGELLDDIFTILSEIIVKEQEEDDEVEDIVLESYDCFRSNEVIMEFILLVQILTITSQINSISSLQQLERAELLQTVNRIYKKCYQLIESKKLTHAFATDFSGIIGARIAEYPESASEPFADIEFNRKSFAEVVLKSEYQSLSNCADLDKTLKSQFGNSPFISDAKLIRNITKRKIEQTESKTSKPSKKKRKAE